MAHTLRFSAFIAMVMLSFALAFFAVFHTCGTDPFAIECRVEEAFGTFGASFVTVFASALAGPDFDIFDDVGTDCVCELPDAARTAGISLMVVSVGQPWNIRRSLCASRVSTEFVTPDLSFKPKATGCVPPLHAWWFHHLVLLPSCRVQRNITRSNKRRMDAECFKRNIARVIAMQTLSGEDD